MELSRLQEDQKIFSFHPDVKESIAKLTGLRAAERPIYERWEEIQKQKDGYLTKLRQIAIEKNPDLSFKPKLNKISENLAFEKGYQEGNLNVPVTQRLMQDAYQKKFKLLEAQQAHLRKIEEECTFQPKINPQSEVLNNPLYVEGTDFIQRMYLLDDQAKEKLDKKINSQIKRKCPFKP